MSTKQNNKSTWPDNQILLDKIALLQQTLNDEYSKYLHPDEEFDVDIYVENEVLFITSTLKNSDESFYYPLELAIVKKENTHKQFVDILFTAFDFIGAYYDDYFSNERNTFVPIDWTTYEFMGIKLYVKGQVLNKKLEKQADELLLKDKLSKLKK